jgi:hypothetical protein
MLDRHITPLIRPAVDALARTLAKRGIQADHVTVFAFALGIFAMISIALHAYLTGAILILRVVFWILP